MFLTRTFLLFSLIISSINAKEIRFVTEALPPLQITENNTLIDGISFDIINAILAKTPHQPSYEVLPWRRAYQEALAKPNTFIFSMIRNKEREDKFIWLGKLFSLHSSLITLKNREDIALNSLDDIKNYTIGVLEYSFGHKYLKSIGLVEKENLHLSIKPKYMWKMLYNKRIDAVFSDNLTVTNEILSSGFDPKKAQASFYLPNIGTDLYLATNKNTDPALINALMLAYQTLKESGELIEIIQRWQTKTQLNYQIANAQ